MREYTVRSDGFTRVMQRGNSLVIVERNCSYVYCLTCGKLKMLHIHEQVNADPTIPHALISPSCTCGETRGRNAPRSGGDSQRLLAEMALALRTGLYHSIEDVLVLIAQLAEREAPRD